MKYANTYVIYIYSVSGGGGMFVYPLLINVDAS